MPDTPAGRPATRGHDLAALRRLNAGVVLRALRRRSPQTIGQLAAAAGLSRPTVEALVEELAGQGWIAEADTPADGTPGRPARRFRFRAEAGAVLGVDIGRRKLHALLARLDGEITARLAVPLDPALPGAGRIAFLRDTLDDFLAEHGTAPGELRAAGLGVPGTVDETGRIRSVMVPDWTDLDLARRLADDLPCPIIVENDANLAVLAEHWRGAAVLADDVVCVLAGRHISCGLMIDGRLHRGRRGGAGELGLLPQLAAELVPRRPAGGPLPDPVDPEALDRYVTALAPGVAAIALAVDPELVVLSGAAAANGPALVPRLAEQLAPLVLNVPRIAVSTLGREGIALGALRAALNRVEAELF